MTDDWFAKNNPSKNAEDIQRDSNARWEQAIVKQTMTYFGLGAKDRQKVGRRWQELHGEFGLRLTVFNEAYEEFPFLLGSARLDTHVHQDIKSTEPSRFKKFGQVPFVQAYQDFYDDVYRKEDLRNVALVFPRKGFKHGMVIHNDSSETFWETGLCWVYKSRTGGRMFVQPYSSLLNGIKDSRSWRPKAI